LGERFDVAFGLVLAAVLMGMIMTTTAMGQTRVTSPVDQPIPLFNGRDLQGWTTWLVDTKHDDPRRVFTVHGGMIRISGDGFGYLGTIETFGDYRLLVQYKWGDRNWRQRRGLARDAGLFLHGVGPDGNSLDGGGAYKAAIECQLMEGASGDLLLIKGRDHQGRLVDVGLTATVAQQRDADGWPWWDPSGATLMLQRTGRLNWQHKDPLWRDEFGYRGRRDAERPIGSWNQLEVHCRQNSIAVWLNDVCVNQARQLQPASGSILLQCEGSEIYFRQVELHPLPSADSVRAPGD
jgi:hypothetical protein